MPEPSHPPLHPRSSRYRFCPVCGGPLDSRLLKGGDPERLVCGSCGYVLYLDPKVAVGTVIRLPDSRIVLVRRAIEPGYGLWVFPGGYVDRGEPLDLAAIREAREECGLDVRLDGLVNIYSSEDGRSVLTREQDFVAVPYHLWAHRGDGEMAVWLPRRVRLDFAVP